MANTKEKKAKVVKARLTAEEKEQLKVKKQIVKNIGCVLKKVSEEYKFVSGNLSRLEKALEQSPALKEDPNHLELLKVQKSAMTLYANVLTARKEYLENIVSNLGV